MKLILLAAFALATPALAQTDNSPPAQPTAADPAMAPPQSDPSTTAPAPAADPSMAPAQTAPAPDSTMADPVGGYQPSQPPMSGTMQPGATVQFQQAPSPDQAYPAPAPMAHYPPCKKGQYDKCMERGGRK